jgi:hypothetical protein
LDIADTTRMCIVDPERQIDVDIPQ